jgi:hypothetical protein
MDYQLSKSSYVLDRDVDVMKRMLKNFDFSEPTKDLMSDLFLLRVKAESPETDAVAAKVFWQQSYKLEDELESEMVSEILDFVREVRAEFNLPKIDVTTEDMLMGRQPQQAR